VAEKELETFIMARREKSLKFLAPDLPSAKRETLGKDTSLANIFVIFLKIFIVRFFFKNICRVSTGTARQTNDFLKFEKKKCLPSVRIHALDK
jgi:hypothetical protein